MNDNNFIADVRKGADLLKSFEQSNLVNNMCSFTYKFLKGQSPTSSHANCVYELFLQSCLLQYCSKVDYCVITRIPSCTNHKRGQSPTLSRASCVTVHLMQIGFA